jgi:tRNA-dihydrouridine synthase B
LHFLATGTVPEQPRTDEIRDVLLSHVETLYDFYGEYRGIRIARKHVGWYLKTNADSKQAVQHIYKAESAEEQVIRISAYFQQSKGGLMAA